VKHAYRDRPATLEDIARELVKGESLETQMAMSVLVAKARQVAKEQQTQAAEGCVIDYERGWILK
jgi:hypothetical protein